MSAETDLCVWDSCIDCPHQKDCEELKLRKKKIRKRMINMKQCAHRGWETPKPEKVSVKLRADFGIRIYLCPECFEAYNKMGMNENKSPVW